MLRSAGNPAISILLVLGKCAATNEDGSPFWGKPR